MKTMSAIASSSLRPTAAIPLFLALAYSSILVFLIYPCSDIDTTNLASDFLFIEVIATTLSWSSILTKVCADTPLDAFVPVGTWSTTSLYIFPRAVNIIKLSIVLVLITSITISSWFLTPTPFLFCTL